MEREEEGSRRDLVVARRGATGLPVVSAPPEAVDVGSIAIRLNPGLTDVRLADVLDAICKVADRADQIFH